MPGPPARCGKRGDRLHPVSPRGIDPFFISRPSKIAERFLYWASDKVRLSLNAADMMVALVTLGAIGAMALAIKQVETRLLRWRPEYQKR